jgi:hypothetical protein
MAHTRLFKPIITIAAMVLIVVLGLADCSSPSGSEPSAKTADTEQTTLSLSETYTAVKNNKTYELTVTQSAANATAKATAWAAFTPAEGDSYALSITENGETQKSSGTVKAFSGSTFTLTASINVSVTFTVAISGSRITNITGTITVEGGVTITGPGSVTTSTGGGGGGGGGSSSGNQGNQGGNSQGNQGNNQGGGTNNIPFHLDRNRNNSNHNRVHRPWGSHNHTSGY